MNIILINAKSRIVFYFNNSLAIKNLIMLTIVLYDHSRFVKSENNINS